MGAKGIDKINSLYDRYLKEKAGSKVSVTWLRRIVAVEIGTDRRTVDAYMHLMVQLKYIRAAETNKIEILKKEAE